MYNGHMYMHEYRRVSSSINARNVRIRTASKCRTNIESQWCPFLCTLYSYIPRTTKSDMPEMIEPVGRSLVQCSWIFYTAVACTHHHIPRMLHISKNNFLLGIIVVGVVVVGVVVTFHIIFFNFYFFSISANFFASTQSGSLGDFPSLPPSLSPSQRPTIF